MISEIDPFIRLVLLSKYMDYWLKYWPSVNYNFEQWIKNKHPEVIPGTVNYIKSIATHCYYCNRRYDKQVEAFKASTDHWTPKSKGQTEKFVICCVDCNGRKGDLSPIDLISQFTKACMKNQVMWGYHGKKLTFIAKQLQTVTNDIIYGIGPRIYYFKR